MYEMLKEDNLDKTSTVVYDFCCLNCWEVAILMMLLVSITRSLPQICYS